VRGTLTTEVWEIQNQTWLDMQRRLQTDLLETDPSKFFEWVKYRSHLSRGVTWAPCCGRGRPFHPPGHLPGAGRQHGAHPGREIPRRRAETGENMSQRDFYYWGAMLRSVSGFEIYRKVYRDVITPARMAELLMLRGDMPRSLLACMDEVVQNLHEVRNDVSADTERFAGRLRRTPVRQDRGYPGGRPARHPDPLPGRYLRTGQPRQPRFPRAAGGLSTKATLCI
jgi:hypothetical protein